MKIVVTDKTVALVLAGIAFGASILGLFIQRGADQQRSDMENRLTQQIALTEARLQKAEVDKETEVRMLEYYLLELDAKVIKAGIKPAEESIAEKLKSKREEKRK